MLPRHRRAPGRAACLAHGPPQVARVHRLRRSAEEPPPLLASEGSASHGNAQISHSHHRTPCEREHILIVPVFQSWHRTTPLPRLSSLRRHLPNDDGFLAPSPSLTLLTSPCTLPTPLPTTMTGSCLGCSTPGAEAMGTESWKRAQASEGPGQAGRSQKQRQRRGLCARALAGQPTTFPVCEGVAVRSERTYPTPTKCQARPLALCEEAAQQARARCRSHQTPAGPPPHPHAQLEGRTALESPAHRDLSSSIVATRAPDELCALARGAVVE